MMASYKAGCRRLLVLLLLVPFSRGNAQTPPVSSKVTDVWIVVKSHFDLGFTDLAANVFHRYRAEMMDNSLKIFDQNRLLPPSQRFVWTVPGWPLSAQMLGPQQDSLRKLRIEQAVREGALTAHALAFSTHTESQDLEDLVRGLVFSANVSRTYHRPLPIAAKMTDVPSHSWIMPVLLQHAGVKFLHIGVNPASQYPRVPKLFWWEGPDGSRVLCGYTVDYGSDFLPPADWPCKNYLCMIMAGDNHGPPTQQEVNKWKQQYEEKMPGVRVHFGTLDDFAHAVLAEKTSLPVVRGDMPDTWIHGLMSMPQATKTARNMRPMEPALESFDTQLRSWGLQPAAIGVPLAKAYEQSLLYSEHTWGMNAEYGPRRLYGDAWKQWMADLEKEPLPPDGDYAKLPRGSKRKWMQSYEDHRNYANTAANIIDTAMRNRLSMLANAVKTKEKSIVVYNALPWKRSGTINMNGQSLWVTDVPANGYKTIPYQEIQQQPMEGSVVVETRFFLATFDLQKGGIKSLIDKSTGQEMVNQSGEQVVGQFIHERFSTNEVYDRFFNHYSRIKDGWGLNDIGKPGMPDATQVPYRMTTPGDWKISHTLSTVQHQVILTATDCKGLAKGYTLIFTFPEGSPYIDVAWQVDNKTPDKHPEGGWLCFPFNIQQPNFRIGRLGAPINPATDIVPGTNRHLFAVNTGVAIQGTNVAVGICPMDAPLVSLDEPGLWRWTMDFIPHKPNVYVNLYNNMWNTNFPLWQDGSWSERVRIWPISQHTSVDENLMIQSWEARLPLLAAIANNPDGQLPNSKQGLVLSRKGILVTAFGTDPNGHAGTLLTLWEQAGITGKVTIQLPDGIKAQRAIPVDLRGEKLPLQAIPIHQGRFAFACKKFAPASFLLQ
ncbi:MAG: hypothetical protein JO154_02100 [Chitinophaga sp.]|uniref:glycoside hydrolase family 38 N-terminal domain-containing protein n=1 Tax=Chitinophaga sp. TaxID=1869181 RepID=UPI0025C39938|nr:hypothetical protein [Chitinophaga sp.]MBV8251373.1 hypothetical protein [Chitinophaga sp.]